MSQLRSEAGKLQGHGHGEDGPGQGTLHERGPAHRGGSLRVPGHRQEVLHSPPISSLPEETRGEVKLMLNEWGTFQNDLFRL